MRRPCRGFNLLGSRFLGECGNDGGAGSCFLAGCGNDGYWFAGFSLFGGCFRRGRQGVCVPTLERGNEARFSRCLLGSRFLVGGGNDGVGVRRGFLWAGAGGSVFCELVGVAFALDFFARFAG